MLRHTAVSLCVALVISGAFRASVGAPQPAHAVVQSGEPSDVADATPAGDVRLSNPISHAVSGNSLNNYNYVLDEVSPRDTPVDEEKLGSMSFVDVGFSVDEEGGGGQGVRTLEDDMIYSDNVLGEYDGASSFAEMLNPSLGKSEIGKHGTNHAYEEPNLKSLNVKRNVNSVLDLFHSSDEEDSGEDKNKPEVLGEPTAVPTSQEDTRHAHSDEVDIEPVLSSKVLPLSGNSYMVFTPHTSHEDYRISLTFQARLKDSILLYVTGNRAHDFHSFMIDASGALIFSTSMRGTEEEEPSLKDAANDEETGSGVRDTFVDTELDSELDETVVEEPGYVSSIFRSNVVDGSWHTVGISWGTPLGHALNVSVDGSLSTYVVASSHGFKPVSFFFGYIPDLDEDCNSVEMCPVSTSTSTSKYQYDVAGHSCHGGHDSGYPSAEHCLTACRKPGVASYNPLSGCLKHVTYNGDELLLSNALGDHVDVLTIVPRGRQVTAPFADSCPQLASPWPTVSLPHHASHFQLPAPCRAPFSLSLEVRSSFPLHPLANPVLLSGHLKLPLPPNGGRGEHKWKLTERHHRLHFSVAGLNRSVASLSVVDTGAWNYVNLSSDGQQVTFSLNGIHHPLTFGAAGVRFVSPITVGDHKMGITACLNNIVLDGNKFDARKFISRKNGVLVGQCMDRELCLHGGQVAADGHFNCDCTNTAFDGPHCQFARYPRSCSEYRHQGYVKSGAYGVDVDGEGPAPPLEVWCDFFNNSTTTTFLHNLPKNFVVKGDTKRTRQLNVSYLGGQALLPHIKKMAASMMCSQKIEFSCKNFPLKLARNKTLFSYGGQAYTNRLSTTRSGVCPCKEKESCSESHVVCNCDVADDHVRSDVVLLSDAQILPLSSFVFGAGNDGDDSELRLSLGNVSCSEPVAAGRTVSMPRSSSRARLTLAKASSLSFAFKTLQADALLLTAAGEPASTPTYEVVLRHGTALILLYDNVEVSRIIAGYPLNSDVWQHVQLDGSDGHMRLTLNGHKTYAEIHNSWSTFSRTASVVTFGGVESPRADGVPGLVGCLKDVRSNLVPADFDEELHTHDGCVDLCVLMDDAHGGRCNMFNMEEEYEAKCAGRLHGSKVDSNIGFRFTDSDAEVLYDLKDKDTPLNPLTNDVTLVFRTRERSALLLFAYDNSQNVLQVHLAEPTLLNVVFNSKFDLKNISIRTNGKPMDNGSPVLFTLERKAHQTSVGVAIDGCWFNSSLQVNRSYILPEEYLQYPFERPPHLTRIPQAKTVPLEFLAVHIGGAMIGGAQSSLPNLIGCVSSFVIGSNPDTFSELEEWKKIGGGVEVGCVDTNSGCGPHVCRWEGRCLPTFTGGSRHTTCDCSQSSYTGVDCTAETCYMFESIANTSSFLASNSTSPDFDVDFAVAVGKKSPHAPRKRTIIGFHTPYEECLVQVSVALTNTSALVLSVSHFSVEEWTLPLWVLRADLLQGHRHHLFLSYKHPTLNFYFNGRHIHLGQPTAKVKRHRCSHLNDLQEPALQTSLWINTGMNEKISLYISNLRLNFQGETYHTFDLFELAEQAGSSVEHSGPILSDKCSIPTAPVFLGAARLPADDAGIAMAMPGAPQLAPYGSEAAPDTEPEETDDDDSSMTLIIVLIAIGVLVLLVIIGVLVWLIYKDLQKKHDKSVNPNVRITHSWGRPQEHRMSTPSNIYVNAETIPLRTGPCVRASAPDQEAEDLFRPPPSYSDAQRLSGDFPLQPPLVMGSLSDEVQGQLGNGHATYKGAITNDEGAEDDGLNETTHLMNYKGLSMANDMLYESAQRQKQLQHQHLLESNYEGNDAGNEVKLPSPGDGDNEKEELLQKLTDQETGNSKLNSDDSHLYEDYDFKEAKNSPNGDQPNELASSNVSSDEENSGKISANEDVQNADVNLRQNRSASPDDDSAAHAAASKGRVVRYSGQPIEPSLANNPLYETAPQIEQEQQQRMDPGRQEESLAQSSLLETSFMKEVPETLKSKVSFSDSTQIEPELKEEGEVPGDASEADDDWLEDDGTSVDRESRDDGWYTRRHLVISLSNAIDLPIQTAKIVSKQSSNL